MSFGNTPVPNAREYYPNTVPAVGTLLNDVSRYRRVYVIASLTLS